MRCSSWHQGSSRHLSPRLIKLTCFIGLTLGLLLPPLAAQPTVHSILGEPEEAAASIPKPRETYQGRRIAQTMHYTGAEWLIRDTREREARRAAAAPSAASSAAGSAAPLRLQCGDGAPFGMERALSAALASRGGTLSNLVLRLQNGERVHKCWRRVSKRTAKTKNVLGNVTWVCPLWCL